MIIVFEKMPPISLYAWTFWEILAGVALLKDAQGKLEDTKAYQHSQFSLSVSYLWIEIWALN